MGREVVYGMSDSLASLFSFFLLLWVCYAFYAMVT